VRSSGPGGGGTVVDVVVLVVVLVVLVVVDVVVVLVVDVVLVELVVESSVDAVASTLFYLVAYAFTNFAAWAVVIALEKSGECGLELEDYAGLGQKHPALAAVMAVAMFSFTGVPPTLGFVGKFFLFRTVLEGGYVGLALIGVLTSLFSAYYYLRVAVIMYMRAGEPAVRSEPWLQATAYLSAIGVVLLSIFSAPLLYLATQAVLQLF